MSERLPGILYLIPCEEYGGEERITMMEIPADPGDGYTVAAEVNAMIQRAYDIGRSHEAEMGQREIEALVKAYRKRVKAIRQ